MVNGISFENLSEWLREVRNQCSPDVMLFIVGNKCDLDEEDREVSFEEGQEWVQEYLEEYCENKDEIDITFMEVSAKSGANIDSLFEEISRKLIEKHKHG